MRIVFAGISIVVAILLDCVFAGRAFFILPFFLTVLVLLYWFWFMPLAGRIFTAFVAGVVIDTFSLFPFGTYLMSLIALAFFANTLRMFLTNAGVRQYKLVGASILFIAFFVSLFPISRVLASL